MSEIDWDAEVSNFARSKHSVIRGTSSPPFSTSSSSSMSAIKSPLIRNSSALSSPSVEKKSSPDPSALSSPKSTSSGGFFSRFTRQASTPAKEQEETKEQEDEDISLSDDEDEKEEKDEWIEFTAPNGQKFFQNKATGQISQDKSAPADDFEDDEDEGFNRPRTHMVDLDGQGSRAPQMEFKMTNERIIKSLQLIGRQVDMILNQSQKLGDAVIEELREIRGKVNFVQDALEKSESIDSKNDVDALIEWDKLNWDFDNPHVHAYRSAAIRAPRPEEFQSWHIPQYFSAAPLPPQVKDCFAVVVVKLPNNDDSITMQTRLNIKEKDTVNAAIQSVLLKVKGLENDGEWVLKVVGLQDFMVGDHLLFDYEYVRECMRDGQEVKLALVRRPAPLPAPIDLPDYTAEYKAKVKNDVFPIQKNDFVNLQGLRDNWQDLKYLPMSEVALPFRFKIIGMDGITEEAVPRLEGSSGFFLRTFLFHGCQNITDSVRDTEMSSVTTEPRWMSWMLSEYNKDTLINALPRATRVAFILLARQEDKEVNLGYASVQIIDEFGRLVTGLKKLKFWTFERKVSKHGKPKDTNPNFIYYEPTRDNQADPRAPILHVYFNEFAVPVVAPLVDKAREPNPRLVGVEIDKSKMDKKQQKQWESLMECDSLAPMTPEDKLLLWTYRHHATSKFSVLPKFLQCVQWGNPEHRAEAYRLLSIWAQPEMPIYAMELLDARFADYAVREYAVNLLRKMTDEDLRLFLLQMVQLVKYEPYHDSPLVRFLIERSLQNPVEIGHYFFWHLKAELHDPHVSERFALILEEYLSFSGRHAPELRKQYKAVRKLQRVSELIVRLKREHGYGDPEAMKEYGKELEKLNRDFFIPMEHFYLPLNPKIEVTSLMIEKCRYMSSKMVPLWIVFKNKDEDAPPCFLIFKSGDDLRQDILTLQILKFMDSLWLSQGLDMKMKPYKCIATGVNDNGEGVGMIEVVLNSDTTSGIQLKYGGGAMGALKLDPIDLFLKEHNKGQQLYEKAVENFVASCAGYCVATFVLGIGDRHNGNIMVTKDGHLFHIDFGHFLGNFKKKFGVNRERAAFVFTPEMAYVMGGKKYKNSTSFKKFLVLCTKAFQCLRANASILENLFLLMVAAGMPELLKQEDIYYMRDKFFLDVDTKKADKKLHVEINKSLDSTYRRIDNMIHNFRHG